MKANIIKEIRVTNKECEGPRIKIAKGESKDYNWFDGGTCKFIFL